MPPSASASAPLRRSVAPVNAPFSWPKRMLSASVGGMLPQSTTTKAPSLRSLASWIALATSSLPVPVSPRMRTRQRRARHLLEHAEDAPHPRRAADEGPEPVGEPDLDAALGLRLEGDARAPDRELARRRHDGLAHAHRRRGTCRWCCPRSLTRMPSLTARSSQWNALTSGSATTMCAPGSRPTTSGSTSMVNWPPSGGLRDPRRRRTSAGPACASRSSDRCASLSARRWCARLRLGRLRVDLQRLEQRELVARDADAAVAEEQRSFSASCARTWPMKRMGSPVRVYPSCTSARLRPLAALEASAPCAACRTPRPGSFTRLSAHDRPRNGMPAPWKCHRLSTLCSGAMTTGSPESEWLWK